MMTLLERFIDPELIRRLTFGEKVLGSLYVTLVGMAITFALLGIVWGFVVLLSKASNLVRGRGEVAVPLPPPAGMESTGKENGALVAVITAAIAAGLGVPPDAIRVRDIVEMDDRTSAWGRLGRIEQLRN